MRPVNLLNLAVLAVLLAGPAAAAPSATLDTLAAQLAARADPPGTSILLLGIADPSGSVSDLERYLSDKLASALTATGRVTLTDDAARRAALAEIRDNLADVIDPKTVQAAGRLAGAAWLVKGTAYVFPEARRADVLVQLIRTETGEYWQAEGSVPLDAVLLGLRARKAVIPAAPVRRAPLDVEMVVVASRPDGHARSRDLGVVREGDRLRSNDEVKVYFRTSGDAYVYLVWVDADGKATLQFPSREAGTDNRVRGGAVHIVPESNRWYYLDDQVGRETLYLVASYDPVPSLAALLQTAETVAAPAAAREGIESLYSDLQTRGVAGVRSGRVVSVASRAGVSSLSAETTLVRGYAQAVRRLTFHHEAAR